MTDQPVSPQQQPDPATAVPGPDPAYAVPGDALGDVRRDVQAYPPHAPATTAQIGRIRSTGTCFLLMIVTLGIYSLVWYFKTHDEMKRHTGEGIGGGIALVLAIFIGIVMPFLSSNEVGRLYERRGQKAPVTALAGLWALLLGWFFFVGLIVWFVKTNSALNAYWRSLGAH